MPRHLPILPTSASSGGQEGPARPPWHWILIGALMAVSVWAPLAMLASSFGAPALTSLLDPTPPNEVDAWLASASTANRIRFWILLAGLPAAAFTLACLIAGALIGRFGSGRGGVREAALAGLIAALFGWVLSVTQGGSIAGAVAALFGTSAVGAGAGAFGAVLGRKKGPKSQGARGAPRAE